MKNYRLLLVILVPVICIAVLIVISLLLSSRPANNTASQPSSPVVSTPSSPVTSKVCQSTAIGFTSQVPLNWTCTETPDGEWSTVVITDETGKEFGTLFNSPRDGQCVGSDDLCTSELFFENDVINSYKTVSDMEAFEPVIEGGVCKRLPDGTRTEPCFGYALVNANNYSAAELDQIKGFLASITTIF